VANCADYFCGIGAIGRHNPQAEWKTRSHTFLVMCAAPRSRGLFWSPTAWMDRWWNASGVDFDMSAKEDPTSPLEKNHQKRQQPESEMRTVIFELFQ